MSAHKLRSGFLIFGDIIVLYSGLVITLFLRYSLDEFEKWFNLHILPFSVLFAIWILIFLVAGLYDPISFSAKEQFHERLIRTMLVAGIVGIILFYLWTQSVITPKTNLVIDLIISVILLLAWRKFYITVILQSAGAKIIFFGWSRETENIARLLQNNQFLGYEPAAVILPSETILKSETGLPVFVLNHDLAKIINRTGARLVVASGDVSSNADFIKMLYEVLPLGIAYLNFAQFYEYITGKIPVSMISEMWFLENLTENKKRAYEAAKRAFDLAVSAVLGVLALFLFPLIILAIKINSPGRAFFRQSRVGKNGHLFELIKFRTMVKDAEKNGAVWAEKDDERITKVGGFLRKTRLDELPQLWNVIKGEMSLIGPRPERPEFVEELKKQIPHYMMRLLVRPGLSGWAQINFPYGASVEDAMEKLQYDLYYIKNRSMGLDLTIALKTLFIMVSRSGR
ncbi:MAG: hypothetical protein A2931_02470 [Candidatus Niyogibacteria bacterium RIFCSPLOWO2_01_FULL_45_48]|uniref:Bacterial sugar transferase domain-containing protein n=2 Tax=Candidatus Niyogiibacteriota TaxID=1817912 RepID=A0A1G2F055_9BACT|nr:MAG: hypothetical protein A2931_02470 [Candidatus Niyogibacteria bacterium RIFCSPLOWO2_01_FULL_45_48]OGZ31474.1 MAG: hypothetical protein A3J00_02545 [Candidatus Niyogibacteria bacterium RIFCSPLOWO2_02_FULL_45_13]